MSTMSLKPLSDSSYSAMPVTPADCSMRIAVSDILSSFLDDYGWSNGPLATLRDQTFRLFSPNHVDERVLHALLVSNLDVRMRGQHRFLFLEPIRQHRILPLMTLQTSHEWIHFRIYILLTMLDDCSNLQALSVRFETDESGQETMSGSRGRHDFCHAQLCRSIDGQALTSTASWIPDSQPSFPLDAEDQVGLVLCMLTSLYGAYHVSSRLRTAGGRDVRHHLQKIRALA